MPKINIIDIKNTNVGEYEIFDKYIVNKIATQAIFDEIIAQNAGKRQGTHSTLTKAEVRGGGKKPVPQKHTGNARQGSIRNPHYVGGGVVFGPKPNQNYKYKLNKQVAQLAIKSALTQKINEKSVVVMKDMMKITKTKDFANFIKLLKLDGKYLLFVLCDKGEKVIKTLKNIQKVDAKKWNQVSTYDLLKAKKIIFSQNALDSFLGGKQ